MKSGNLRDAVMGVIGGSAYRPMASLRLGGIGKRFRLWYDIILDLEICCMGSQVSSFGTYPYQRIRYTVSPISAFGALVICFLGAQCFSP